MSHRYLPLVALMLCAVPAHAATEKEAAAASARGDFADAARQYGALLAHNPKSIPLRLALADALAKDRQWDQAAAEYETVSRDAPQNTEALRGLGTVRRWQGRLPEARAAYAKARALNPMESDALLGLAATERQDHDFAAAEERYAQAEKTWPRDEEVRESAYSFRREANPRVYAYYEDDLSFRTRQFGVAAPLLAREEIGYERQQETGLTYSTGGVAYTRTDDKLFYTHFFAYRHTLDASARHSAFDYPVAPGPGYTTSIGSYDEYRLRYAAPLLPTQIAAVRYTARPTVLAVTGASFTAHKVEAELESHWTPGVQTLIGAGWLRDLDTTGANAQRPTLQRDDTLVKLGAQWDITNQWSVSARYITNPDLDASINDTRIAQVQYGFAAMWSAIGRYKHDDYKQGDDQTAWYLGLRFSPNAHLWSEFGAKQVFRGTASGSYPLASVVWRF